MRWLTFRGLDGPHAGYLDGDTVHDLGPKPLESWLNFPDEARATGSSVGVVAKVELLQPVLRPGKILGIGVNYAAHAAESVSFLKNDKPAVQKWFVKQATAAAPPFGEVALPIVSDELDYEAELVVVIGKRGRHVPKARAMEIVAGFTCGCDYSVRDWQRASPTMIMGKGFDTHAPFGPVIVSPDEIDDVGSLMVRSRVNGDIRQEAPAGDMIFSVSEQIAHLTAAFTLEPGDVIFTGTPAGVGAGFDPPKFLKEGDVVRVEVDGIGHIEQRVVAESGATVIG